MLMLRETFSGCTYGNQELLSLLIIRMAPDDRAVMVTLGLPVESQRVVQRVEMNPRILTENNQ